MSREGLQIASTIFATHSGLGILAKSFVDNKVITHPIIIRHGRHPNNFAWYPDGTPVIADLRRDTAKIVEETILRCGIGLMLFLETPHDWSLLPLCKKHGVKTVLMPMYECMPERLPEMPDYFLCPSLLDQSYYSNDRDGRAWVKNKYPGERSVFLMVPVDTSKFKWKQRDTCEVFVHNAGHGGLKGRNGTIEVIQAFKDYVKSPAKLILRCQGREFDSIACELVRKKAGSGHIYFAGTKEPEELYLEGDCFLFPEAFNGCSLPLQESYTSGMLVMCGERFPMTTWLPREPMIPVQGYEKERIGPPYNVYDRTLFHPKTIAKTVDEWFGKPITKFSKQGKDWAERHNWETLGPEYIKVLEWMANN